MHFLVASFLLAFSKEALSCGVSWPRVVRTAVSETSDLAKRQDITILPSDGNGTHWTVAQNLRQMQVSDDAFIARDLAKFNHHPNSTMYYPMGVVMNLSEHLQDMRLTFSSFSDAAPHNHNYRVSFGEGDWTVAIARAAGTNDGPLADATGALLPPTRRTVNYDLMTISRWNAGLMMEEHLWTDNPRLFRLLGLLPSPPPVDIPDIELNPHTAPLSTIPGVDSSTSNKAKVNKANAAFNNVKFDAESLHLSSNLTVYGLDDQPYDLQAYMRFLNQYKTAFPDLHIENNQIIAQGDWVATISMLSGTHQGPLTLPLYLSSSPIQATGKKFNLLHYTISRWQNGEIVEMRVNLDLFGILVALGISF